MTHTHIGQMISETLKKNAKETAVAYKSGTSWTSLTYDRFGEKVYQLASALIQTGVNAGDTVGIYSANRYEWAMTDFACTQIGAVSVPIYATNTKDQADFIINDAGIKIVFTGNRTQYENIESILAAGRDLTVISYDTQISLDPAAARPFDTFLSTGDPGAHAAEMAERQSRIKPDDTTTIIYTSGTTGNPKGVMLCHSNLFHQFRTVDARFDMSPADTSLCFLPLSHVFERVWSYYVFSKGAANTYLEDPKLVIDTLKEVRPTAMVSVPRLYEKIYAVIMNGLETASPVKKAMFHQAIAAGKDLACRKKRHQPISLGLKLKHRLLDKLVLSKIRDAVGGEKNFFIVGGAPLEKSIEEFFFACGLLICQGYGLTETSPIISYNTPPDFRFGTVGKPAPECEVRIADNGEIQVKGPQVMKGYYNNPEKTAGTFDGEWFKTGDVGEFDDDGFLKITDRIKDLIITSGGKNIAPQHIETLVGKDFFIEQIIAIGDKRQFVSALIVPSFEALETWAEKMQITYDNMEDLVQHPNVISLYEKRIALQSKLLAQYETIKKFRLIPRAFTIEDGEITPTLKLKRKAINENFRDLIDDMYTPMLHKKYDKRDEKAAFK